MTYLRTLSISVVCLLVLSTFTRAGTVPITFASQGREDTYRLNVAYKYQSAHSGTLDITSTVISYTSVSQNYGAGPFTTYNPTSFNLHVDLDPSTGLASSGRISLSARPVGTTGPLQSIWYSTSLTDFGVSADMREFDFKFIQSGSSLLKGIGDGSRFGIMVFALNGFTSVNPNPTNWLKSFTATGAKNDGAGLVPLPSAMNSGFGLLAMLALAAVGQRLRQRRVLSMP
jgi:hypothetical protein